MENLIDIGGVFYTLDLATYGKEIATSDDSMVGEEVEESVTLDNTGAQIEKTIITRKYDKAKEIDGSKYDAIRMCLEILLTFNEEIDDTLGVKLAMEKTPISFKIAFNTLLQYGILKEVE